MFLSWIRSFITAACRRISPHSTWTGTSRRFTRITSALIRHTCETDLLLWKRSSVKKNFSNLNAVKSTDYITYKLRFFLSFVECWHANAQPDWPCLNWVSVHMVLVSERSIFSQLIPISKAHMPPHATTCHHMPLPRATVQQAALSVCLFGLQKKPSVFFFSF